MHQYRGEPWGEYFRNVEAIMDDYGGRPHWGKFHYQTHDVLAERYPRWDEFAKVRAAKDPDRHVPQRLPRSRPRADSMMVRVALGEGPASGTTDRRAVSR